MNLEKNFVLKFKIALKNFFHYLNNKSEKILEKFYLKREKQFI
jgi:hypothetical protein